MGKFPYTCLDCGNRIENNRSQHKTTCPRYYNGERWATGSSEKKGKKDAKK